MNIKRDRKSLFLASTILRGRLLKSPDDDGIQVGPGFAEAAARVSGDDSRTEEEKGKQQLPEAEGAQQNETDGAAAAAAEGDDQGDDGDQGDGDGDDGDAGDEGKPEKQTAKYIRELKKQRREERRELAELRQEIAALKNGGLPKGQEDGNSGDTSKAPDPNDAAKYPLGVLDDRYIEDKIEFVAGQKSAQLLNGRLQSEREQAETARAEAEAADLRGRVDKLTDIGADKFEDFEEKVLEAGLRGDWKLTKDTFVSASEQTHGAEILYNLASDKAEAARVASLPFHQQVAYVIEKNAEIAAAKPAPRNKPQAGAPPGKTPSGRSSSNPIRPDTDNLKDFKKLWYQDQN